MGLTGELVLVLHRADTGGNPVALFHSTDAQVRLWLPVTLAGHHRTIRVTIPEDNTTGDHS